MVPYIYTFVTIILKGQDDRTLQPVTLYTCVLPSSVEGWLLIIVREIGESCHQPKSI